MNHSWGFILCKHTVFLRYEPELRVYFVQKHSVFELQTRVESLVCPKTQCFWSANQSWGFILCNNTVFLDMNQIWGFILHKNTVFLSYEPELNVYFVQKHSVFEIWTRVEGLFCAETQCSWDMNQSWGSILHKHTVFRGGSDLNRVLVIGFK